MTSPIKTFLLLGASGDLAGRLLLPAFGQLLDAQPHRRDIVLIGAGAEDWDEATWTERVRTSFAEGQVSTDTRDAVLATTQYHRADVTAAPDLTTLVNAGPPAPALFFALPPAVTVLACTALQQVALPPDTALVLEKPFGTDEMTAVALNQLLTQLVGEEQVHRVDHFLGRSTVLNLLGLRFANRLFEPVWNAEHIESVEITFDEQLTLENRARYYDRAGAMVDMIQSHLLQVLSLVAMEAPSTLGARDVRDAKAQVLRATRVWGDDPAASSRRARYTAGEIDGRRLPSYADEHGIAPRSTTETLAEVVLAVDTWRWAGVPFRLRSGKALGEPHTEIAVTFRQPPWVPAGLTGHDRPDRLRVGIGFGAQGLELDINVNGPGDPTVVDPATLRTDLAAGELPEYGEVLKSVLEGDPILSVRDDMAVECWRIVDPVLEAWRDDGVPLQEYRAGSTGPAGWPLSGEGPASR